MSDPVFLTAAQVEAFHQRGLELYGGSEGLRDRFLFESAVAQAQAFLDGNKRAAISAGLTFLKLNGVKTDVELTKPLYNALIDIAEHRLDREGLAMLLRELLA